MTRTRTILKVQCNGVLHIMMLVINCPKTEWGEMSLFNLQEFIGVLNLVQCPLSLAGSGSCPHNPDRFSF
jgi:hypothetical protein